MTALTFILGLIGLSAALSIIMTFAWLVWCGSRNSGWVDTIWTFGLGAVGFVGAVTASPMHLQSFLVAAMAAIWSFRLGSHIALRTAGISDDPRYAAFAREWGADSPRKMFIFLQNQDFDSIPRPSCKGVAA